MLRPLTILLVIGSILAGCGGEDEEEDLIAIVQGERITRDEAWELMGADPGTPIPVEVVDRLIRRRLVLREALDLGITVSEEEVERLYQALATNDEVILAGGPAARMREQKLRDKVRENLIYEAVVSGEVLGRIEVTEKEITSYYREHADELSRRLISFYQIVTGDSGVAEEVLRRLEEGEDFEELAKSFSITPEGAVGGLVEIQSPEDLPRTLTLALEDLEIGEIGGPVVTDYGVHILLVREETGEETVPPLAEVRNRIHDILFEEKSNTERERWLDGLWAKSLDTIWRAETELPAE